MSVNREPDRGTQKFTEKGNALPAEVDEETAEIPGVLLNPVTALLDVLLVEETQHRPYVPVG